VKGGEREGVVMPEIICILVTNCIPSGFVE